MRHALHLKFDDPRHQQAFDRLDDDLKRAVAEISFTIGAALLSAKTRRHSQVPAKMSCVILKGTPR